MALNMFYIAIQANISTCLYYTFLSSVHFGWLTEDICDEDKNHLKKIEGWRKLSIYCIVYLLFSIFYSPVWKYTRCISILINQSQPRWNYLLPGVYVFKRCIHDISKIKISKVYYLSSYFYNKIQTLKNI